MILIRPDSFSDGRTNTFAIKKLLHDIELIEE